MVTDQSNKNVEICFEGLRKTAACLNHNKQFYRRDSSGCKSSHLLLRHPARCSFQHITFTSFIILLMRWDLFATLRSAELGNWFFEKTLLESLWYGIDENILRFFNPFKSSFNEKRIKLETNNAVSSGGQGNLTYFMYLPCPPLEARMSTLKFCFLFTRSSDPSIAERNYPTSSNSKKNFYNVFF